AGGGRLHCEVRLGHSHSPPLTPGLCSLMPVPLTPPWGPLPRSGTRLSHHRAAALAYPELSKQVVVFAMGTNPKTDHRILALDTYGAPANTHTDRKDRAALTYPLKIQTRVRRVALPEAIVLACQVLDTPGKTAKTAHEILCQMGVHNSSNPCGRVRPASNSWSACAASFSSTASDCAKVVSHCSSPARSSRISCAS